MGFDVLGLQWLVVVRLMGSGFGLKTGRTVTTVADATRPRSARFECEGFGCILMFGDDSNFFY